MLLPPPAPLCASSTGQAGVGAAGVVHVVEWGHGHIQQVVRAKPSFREGPIPFTFLNDQDVEHHT